MTHYEPWYTNINPDASLPTMLGGSENIAISDPIKIMEYMNENFTTGTNHL